jgi:hypothetical protein
MQMSNNFIGIAIYDLDSTVMSCMGPSKLFLYSERENYSEFDILGTD